MSSSPILQNMDDSRVSSPCPALKTASHLSARTDLDQPSPSDIISPPRALRRPPDAGKWQGRARLVVGLVVDLDVVADEVVEIEQPYGDGCAAGFVAGLLGEAAGRDVEATFLGAQPADAALRTEAQTRALKLALQTLGELTGPGINYFDFDNVGYVMTATEVSSDN